MSLYFSINPKPRFEPNLLTKIPYEKLQIYFILVSSVHAVLAHMGREPRFG